MRLKPQKELKDKVKNIVKKLAIENIKNKKKKVDFMNPRIRKPN